MADNFSDDSSNDGLVPVWSDSDDSINHVNGETPPQSPRVLDPYINPDDITEIPLVLQGWRNDIGWPQYQQQPFDQIDFPVTGEPAQQTMPIVVAKVNELDDRMSAAEMEIENKADYQDITITRQGTRDVREMVMEFGQTYNENLLIIDALQTAHGDLVNELEIQHALDERRRKAQNARMITMGRTIARLNAEIASTSRARKKRKTKHI